MKFVSKYAKYRHLVESGSIKKAFDKDGHVIDIETGASFWADFSLGGLEPAEADMAVAEFTRLNPNDPFGALPRSDESSIDATEAVEDMQSDAGHEAYNARQRISSFDTEDGRVCPARWKERVEEVLLGSSDFGRDFICLDTLTLVPPWPAYDEMEPDQIVQFALEGGYDLDAVRRYEKNTKKRPEVGVPLKKALDARAARRAEAAALTVSA